MSTNENKIENTGDEVMKAVGELKQRTKNLNEVTSDENNDAEEIGSWITAIGKAILTIFK